MSPANVSLWKCQRCGHDEADHLGSVPTIPVAKMRSRLVPEEIVVNENESGKCHVAGCDCKQFQAAVTQDAAR
jgi:hypothetical protein